MRQGARIGLAIAAIGGLAGCKKPQKHQDEAKASSLILPRQVADIDPAGVSTSFDVDEKSGRPKAILVLRLDYFPDPKPGVTNLPVCYAGFPATYNLGVAVCDAKPEIKATILAGSVEQDCYTDPEAERIAATQTITLPGCRRASVQMHQFDPQLRVDAEVQKVN